MRGLPILAALPLLLSAVGGHAQGVSSDSRTDKPHGFPLGGEGAAAFDAGKPWTLGVLLPFVWQSNPASAPSNPRTGTDLAPEVALGRVWQAGSLEVAVEGGLFLSDMSLSGYDSSGWFGTATLTLGDATEQFAPWLRYDVVAVYLDRFDTHDLTRHGFSVGVSRSFGDTALEAFATRSPTSGGVADRNVIGLSLQQGWQAGPVGIVVSGDVEQRFYDYDPEFGRHRSVNRAHVAASAELPVTKALTLQLAAEAMRYRSNDPDWCFTNFVIGPRLAVQFGF
ncbi:hypothetical protein FJQ54_15375 [Sandaracinobacter neustonicus]|uniref:Uncharacterized protein n=1 Tax=Sandaracinobacter neustonicus TaxID=1715348 RepID=A0A501XDA3_9SPHN|nr:hypothetical protein [Sandaracinobacter neustonicus]TPE58456.1 hypothetical protein FJQ54_15375 [Sandaracinobacter neustonicus]